MSRQRCWNWIPGILLALTLASAAPADAQSPSITAVDPQSTLFSASAQNVTLTATVTWDGYPVGCGSVTFQVKDGMTNVGTAVTDTALTSGGASVSYTLPAATGPGAFTIEASYDGTGCDEPSSIGTNTLTVDQSSDVGFSKTFLPDTIGPGSTTTLQFDIDNSTPTPVTDLAFTDVLPAGVTIATPATAFTDCTFGVLSAPDGGTTIGLTEGTLGAYSSCYVIVNVVGTSTATNVSGSLTSSDGNSGAASATLTVDVARPGFSKSFAPSSIALGGRSTLTFTIDNSLNGGFATSLIFGDTLPTGMVVADPSNAATDCDFFSAPVVTAVPGTGVVGLLSGGVGAGGTCTVSIDVVGNGVGSLDNVSGELTSLQHGSVGKASDTLDVTVTPLAIQKSFTDDPVPPGSTVTLDFTIDNFDRFDSATGIAFTDDLTTLVPALAGLTFNSLLSNSCGGTVSGVGGTTIGFSGGTLAPEASCTISTSLSVPGGATPGIYTNTTGAVTATVGGSPVTGNMASEDLFVEPAPLLTKTFMGDPVGAGDAIVLEFTVTNTSPTSSATDIAFQDLFDAVLPTASVTPGNNCCGAGSTCTFTPLINPLPPAGTIPATLTISGASLAPAGMAGDSCTFSITLDVLTGAATGTYPNTTTEITATVDGATRLGKPASDSFDIVAAPSLVKEFTDDPVNPGATVTLEFTLTHDEFAPGDATGITFTDDLAAAMTGLAGTGLPLADVCGPGNGTLTGSAGDTLLTFAGATLTPGETCTFSVTLDVPDPAAAGSHTNTTSSVVATVLGVTATGNAASDDLEIAGLVFTKEFIDDPVLPGDTVTLRFTLDNMHPTDNATEIVFTDNLDAALSGLTAEAPLPDTSTCDAGSSITGTTFLVFSGGTVDAGMSCFFDVTVRVPAGAVDGTYNNATSSVNATLGGSPFVGNPATDALIVNADLLAFTKEFTDDPVAPGGIVTLEFALTNQATEAVSDIAFTDDLDATLAGLVATGLPISECGGTVSTPDGGSTIALTGGSLAAAGAAGDSCTFSVALSVPPDVLLGTTATNTTSEVTGTLGGGAKLGVTGGPAIDELRISSLDFSKAFDGPAPAGGTVVLTFSIVNLDASAGVSEIEFSDDLDLVVSGLEATGLPVSDVCGPGSVLGGTSVLSLGGGSLGPGASCTFSVTLEVPMTAAARTYTNITGSLLVDSAPVGVPAVADLEVVSDAAIEITKTPAQPQVFAGDAVTFTIALRNLGSVDLTNLAVSDPLTPDCDRVAGDLPTLVPGSSTSYTCDTVPLFADLTNVATVTADIPAGPPVSASDTGAVEVLDPAVTITKTPATQQILAGETAAFTITLTNVSDTGLINVMVSDPATPACDRSGGEGTPVLPDLAPGQSVFYVCTTDPLGSDLVNVATVTAVTREGLPVSASASAAVEVIVPIDIIKSPSEQTILPGATATFTITLNNPGTVAKTNVVVSDPLTPDCDNTLANLAPGATFSYTCTTDPLFADLTNIASVTAETPAGTVEASSTALVDVVDPAIEIAKTPDAQLVLPGGTASFTVTVTNPGTDALTDVEVSDPLTPDCDFTIASLPAGGSQSKVCTTGALANDFTNVATVTATSVAGAITASASALVNVRNPVEIVKAPAEQSVPFGGIATFTITLINDGDTVLTDVAVSDPLAPDCDRAAGTLGDLQPMGGQFTYTCSTDALVADLINQATVTAQGSEGTVSASDNALVDVLTDLQLTKTPTDQQLEAGSAATFTITLTNGGTEVVTGIVVADPQTPACDNTVASLDPGASISYDCTTEPLAFDLVNVATATGLVPEGVVSAIATARVEVSQPLVITKDPAEQEILAGETAGFTITVTNPSQITRTDIAVSDPLTPSCDRAAGVLGDLAPGASTSYTCTTGPLFADLTNVATATGQGPAGTVTVSDTAFVLVLNSEISITKTPEAQLVSPGATASFTITLTNPGPAGLTDLSVTDPLTPACDRAVGTLPDLPAATSTSYTCQTGPLTADFINLATVNATSETGLPVTATASASVNVRNPIEILKAPFEQQVPEGASAAFTITITNDGDTLKTNVAVSDPLSPDCARAAGTLPDLDPLGGSFSYMCQSGPVFTNFVNVATVNANSPSEPVTASDSAAVIILPPDYGDAPAPYPTLLANDGARHAVTETPFFLGIAFDSEVDGQPNADATGDDVSGIDDEDGVAFPPMALGLTATVEITLTGTGGLVNAWIDFNADGDWNDAGEQIMADVPVVAGVNSFNYTVPSDAATGDTFARVRLDSGGGLLPTGLAADGEVEDYMVNIVFSFDTVPPTVTLINSVFDTGDGTVEECETAQVEISKLLVTFSEPVQDPPGDTDPDDVTNPANYLVVAAGPDADFDTTVCGTVFGDDVQVPVHAVSYDDGGPIATLDLGRLPSSLIRLVVCGSTSIHDLAGNPLDGNGNGTGGDDFVLTFRSDPTNLFANGHFDCDADGWVLSSTTPGEIFHSTADSDASSLSGSLEFMQLGVNTVYSAEQCADVMIDAEFQLSAVSQVSADAGVQLSLTAGCTSHTSADCTGPSLGTSSTTAILGDSGASWQPIALSVPEQPGRMSVLCTFTVRVPGGDDFTLRLDQLFLGAGTLIFKDGFESGDTSAWSSEVGGSP